jgi:hypothetical protein
MDRSRTRIDATFRKISAGEGTGLASPVVIAFHLDDDG